MEKKKCSLKEHLEIEAINFCKECKIYMCNKCEKLHSGLFQNHYIYNIDKNINEIFTGFCQEKNHNDELEFFCKTHNQLCCAKCIIKIKREGKGQHINCDVCNIEEIKEEKKNKLNENIKLLNELLISIEESINQLKIIFEKINEKKEEVKLNIQKIFTKIRNSLNQREDELLLEVDKNFISENIIKESEKLSNKIKSSLEKGKEINKEWNNNNNKLSSLINDCINIENNLKEFNNINECLKNNNNFNDLKIKFIPDNDENIINILEMIKNIGNKFYNNFKFKKCPINIDKERTYIISGENENIATKTGSSLYYSGVICQKELEKSRLYEWKIKILNTKEYYIKIGISTIDFDQNRPLSDRCGWYYFCKDGSLYSGPPHNYKGKETNLKNKLNEITIVMDMDKRALKFIIDNEDKGDSYTNIPIDKPIFPTILLYHVDDSVEII